MTVNRAVLVEPKAPERRALKQALTRAGLSVETVAEGAPLPRTPLLVLGPSVSQPSKLAKAFRKEQSQALLLVSQRELKAAPFADGILPLPLSAPDLRVRLPELSKLKLQKIQAKKTARLVAPPLISEPVMDPLTQFFTFGHFKDVLFMEVKRARRYGLPLAVALISFDPMGVDLDPPLRAQLFGGLALAIRRSLRDIDLPVQYGTDRVLLVLPHTDLTGGLLVAERIRNRVFKARLAYEDQELRPSVSVGLASTTPARELSFGEVARWAQQSLDLAMREGGNQVRFYDAVNAS